MEPTTEDKQRIRRIPNKLIHTDVMNILRWLYWHTASAGVHACVCQHATRCPVSRLADGWRHSRPSLVRSWCPSWVTPTTLWRAVHLHLFLPLPVRVRLALVRRPGAESPATRTPREQPRTEPSQRHDRTPSMGTERRSPAAAAAHSARDHTCRCRVPDRHRMPAGSPSCPTRLDRHRCASSA